MKRCDDCGDVMTVVETTRYGNDKASAHAWTCVACGKRDVTAHGILPDEGGDA